MEASPGEQDILRDLRARSYAEGGVFWIQDDALAVFDPDAAQRITALNFSDLTLPDKFVDVLLGRKSKPFSWKDVRAAWIAQMRRLSDGEAAAQLAARMCALLDERLDRPLDLVWVAQEVCSRALVPVVMAGLDAADTARVLRDQTLKIEHLLATGETRDTWWDGVSSVLIQVRAGLVVRRELRGRAAGRRPRRPDLADAVVDLLPDLGLGRAVDAVTGVLTAISGPPGAAAACLLYELVRRPEWAARLAAELDPVPLEELCAAPTRVAPVTHRFVKETLRVWSPPTLLTRSVRTGIELEQARLEVGQRYLLSPILIHHDPRHWKDPDTFDPDRWLPGAEHGPCSQGSYIPFGWAPRSCIGASLGTTQLILLCYLATTRYRIEVAEPQEVRMALASVPLPVGFHGTITRRETTAPYRA